mgnify:CR=1 FL=1
MLPVSWRGRRCDPALKGSTRVDATWAEIKRRYIPDVSVLCNRWGNWVERFETVARLRGEKSRPRGHELVIARNKNTRQEKDAEWKFSDPARYRPLSRRDSIRAPVELRLIKGQIGLEVGRRSAERGSYFN